LAAVRDWEGWGGVRGLGLCMAVLVGLQYTETLPTVHRCVLLSNPSAGRTGARHIVNAAERRISLLPSPFSPVVDDPIAMPCRARAGNREEQESVHSYLRDDEPQHS